MSLMLLAGEYIHIDNNFKVENNSTTAARWIDCIDSSIRSTAGRMWVFEEKT